MSEEITRLAQIAGIMMALAYIPQQIKIIRVRSSRGVSLSMYLMVFVAMVIYEVYAVSVREPVFMVTNSASLAQVSLMLFLIWRFR